MTDNLHPKMTFLQLLETLEQANNGLVDVDMEELSRLLATKTDAIARALKEMEERERYLRDQAQEITKAARELKRAGDVLRDRVKHICEVKGELTVVGELWKISVTPNGQPVIKITEDKPDPSYLSKYQGCVRLELVWDKDGIKEYLGEIGELPFAELEYGKHLRVTVNKSTRKPAKKKELSSAAK